MLLASYHSTRPGWQGIANRLIRWRLHGIYSHNEIVFEPGDGVDAYMPDGTCAPDSNGALWCVSSVAAERLPAWSKRRAGKVGGVRFKRIKIDLSRWHVWPLHTDPKAAALISRRYEGAMYDWQLIAGFLSWLIPHKRSRWTCSEFCAYLLGLHEPERFDTCSLHIVAAWAHTNTNHITSTTP